MLNIQNTFANPAALTDSGYEAPHRFLILGLGESGLAMAKWCLRNGAQVRMADTRNQSQFTARQLAWVDELRIAGLKDIQFGPLADDLLVDIDVIGISPGLSPLEEPTQSFLVKARKSRIDVWSEIEFFSRAIAALSRMSQTSQSSYAATVLAVTGTNGKTTTVRLVAHLLRTDGHRVGMTTTDGVYIENERIDTGDCSGPKSARNVLMHPQVDAAVFETARGGILREGLGFDACDVGVITNIGDGDHLGMSYIETVEELAEVKGVIVRNVSPSGHAVLNAADPMVVKMAKTCRGQIIYFALNSHHPVISTHRAQGKKVLFREKDEIIAAIGSKIIHRITLANIPLTDHGQIGFQVENTLASIGAAWALNIDWKLIEQGLASFVSDAKTAPGRFNLFKHKGATVIADYGHNPDAIRALVQATNSFPANNRHVVISGAGDRRDEDIRLQTQILGEAFDSVILYQDQCQRGREDGEVLALLREGLIGAKKTKDIQEIRGEFLAIDVALEQLNPNDLCLILIDQVEESLNYLQKVTKP